MWKSFCEMRVRLSHLGSQLRLLVTNATPRLAAHKCATRTTDRKTQETDLSTAKKKDAFVRNICRWMFSRASGRASSCEGGRGVSKHARPVVAQTRIRLR